MGLVPKKADEGKGEGSEDQTLEESLEARALLRGRARHAVGETLAQCSLRYSVRDGASMREVPRIGMASLPLPLAPSARSTSSADTCRRAGTA